MPNTWWVGGKELTLEQINALREKPKDVAEKQVKEEAPVKETEEAPVEEPSEEPKEETPEEKKARLQKELDDKGVKYDKRWGADRLQELIDINQ